MVAIAGGLNSPDRFHPVELFSRVSGWGYMPGLFMEPRIRGPFTWPARHPAKFRGGGVDLYAAVPLRTSWGPSPPSFASGTEVAHRSEETVRPVGVGPSRPTSPSGTKSPPAIPDTVCYAPPDARFDPTCSRSSTPAPCILGASWRTDFRSPPPGTSQIGKNRPTSRSQRIIGNCQLTGKPMMVL